MINTAWRVHVISCCGAWQLRASCQVPGTGAQWYLAPLLRLDVTGRHTVQAGQLAKRSCGKCGHLLGVSYTAASFQQAAGPASQEGAASSNAAGGRSTRSEAQRRAAKRDALAHALDKLQVGQPLPGTGTCKHYRHSHRYATLATLLHGGCSLLHAARAECKPEPSDCAWRAPVALERENVLGSTRLLCAGG